MKSSTCLLHTYREQQETVIQSQTQEQSVLKSSENVSDFDSGSGSGSECDPASVWAPNDGAVRALALRLQMQMLVMGELLLNASSFAGNNVTLIIWPVRVRNLHFTPKTYLCLRLFVAVRPALAIWYSHYAGLVETRLCTEIIKNWQIRWDSVEPLLVG